MDQPLETKDGAGDGSSKSPWLEIQDTNSHGEHITRRVRPLGDRVMIRKSKGLGLSLTLVSAGRAALTAVQKRFDITEGVVVAVGPTVPEGAIETGDAVLFLNEEGQNVKVGMNSEDYLVLAEEQVVALLSKESPLQEKDRFSRINLVRNNWIILEWEEASEEIKTGSGLKLLRAQTFKEAHYTGIIRKMGPDVMEELKDGLGKRVLFDRWAYEFRENCWYEPGKGDEPRKRYALILDHRIHCFVPERSKIVSPGFEEVPDDGPSAIKVEVDVKPDTGRVYG